jgi:predicted ATP-dependent Lon-type protease
MEPIQEPAPEPELEEILEEREELFKLSMKFKRNILLNETDKYLLSDYPITPEKLEIVKEYRQKLREITNNNYEMPIKPEFIITLN